jgi:two-component system, cell cycle sensor histidine kinase and response regulator CckA
MLGMKNADIIAADEVQRVAPEMARLKAGEVVRSEWKSRSKDGSVFPSELSATILPDGRALAIIRDVSERKKLEQQFLRAQRMDSIGTLAGGIAHDLNNALGPILMSLDLLKLRFPDPGSQELISIIGTSAQRGADMVRQVLSFARGVEGRRDDVVVRDLLQDVERIVNDTFLKNIVVTLTLSPELWTVVGDPTQLHQVLLNLCVNARDALPNGGKLGISAENRTLDARYVGMNLGTNPGPYVVIQVEDNGTGMPQKILDNIFDPFFTTKDIGRGTGLGLSTSMAIVKSHGGFIQVYSEEGIGTTFRVYLPARDNPSPPALEPISELPRGQGSQILVIEDEVLVGRLTRQTLEAFGYRVLLASDGIEGAAVYADHQHEIAAVITDMMMPVMDGPATIKALKAINPAVRIIATSGLSSVDLVEQVARLGVKSFLPKPYTAQALLNVLKEVINGART